MERREKGIEEKCERKRKRKKGKRDLKEKEWILNNYSENTRYFL